MGVKDFFTNRAETRDDHRREDLKSRYYKVNKPQAMQLMRQMIESDPRLRLLDYSEDHGEISAEYIKPRKAFMVVSVITVLPFQTAIDFTITTKTFLLPIDWGFSRKQIYQFYEKLDKQLQFVGVGLGDIAQ